MMFFNKERNISLLEITGALIIVLVGLGVLKVTQRNIHQQLESNVSDFLVSHVQQYYFSQMTTAVFAQESIHTLNKGIEVRMPSGVKRLLQLNEWNSVGLIDVAGSKDAFMGEIAIEILPQVHLFTDSQGKRREVAMQYRWRTENLFESGFFKAIKAEKATYKPLSILREVVPSFYVSSNMNRIVQ